MVIFRHVDYNPDGKENAKGPFQSNRIQKWQRANSRPEPLFKYFSKARAFASQEKAKAVSIFQGLNFAVCGQ